MSFVSLLTQNNLYHNSNFLNPLQLEKLVQCMEKKKLFSMIHSISGCLGETGLEKRYLDFLENDANGRIQRTEEGFVIYNKDGSYVTITFEKNLKNSAGLPYFKVDYIPPSFVYRLGEGLRNGVCKVLKFVNTNLLLLNQRIPSLNIFPGAMASSVTQKDEEIFYYTLSERPPEFLEPLEFPSLVPSLLEPRHSYVDYPTPTHPLFTNHEIQENKRERERKVSEDLRNLTQRIREEVEKSQWSKYVPPETKKFCRSFIFQYKNLGHLLEDLSEQQEKSFYSPLVAQSLTLGYSPEDPSLIELWREFSDKREVISFDITSFERMEIEAECADLLYTVVLYEIFPKSQTLLEPKQEIQYVQNEWEKFKYSIKHDKDFLKNAYLKFFDHLRLRIFYQVRNMYLEHEKIAEKKGIKIRPNKKLGDMITSWTCKLPDGKYFKFKYDHGIKL